MRFYIGTFCFGGFGRFFLSEKILQPILDFFGKLVSGCFVFHYFLPISLQANFGSASNPRPGNGGLSTILNPSQWTPWLKK
jgi:hypothetical protein